jgi:hypothetical protein
MWNTEKMIKQLNEEKEIRKQKEKVAAVPTIVLFVPL